MDSSSLNPLDHGLEKVLFSGATKYIVPIRDPEKRKAKQREYSAKYYAKNKQLVIDRNRRARARRKKIWDNYKKTLSCSVCGFSHPAAMDFHHLPGTKKHNVHTLTRNGLFAEAMQEIQNCIVLCANCHRIHHYNEAQNKKRKRKKKGAKAP